MPTTIKRGTPEQAAELAAKRDWTAFDATTDEDIARHIAEDPDAPPDFSDRMHEGTVLVPVGEIRRKLGMSQEQFASTFKISVGTLRHWERGARQPEGPARTLLTVIEREPEAVKRALGVKVESGKKRKAG